MIISDKNRTIFALSTPKGHSALAIIRITGAQSILAARHFGINDELPANYAKPYKLRMNNNIIDQVLLIFFQSPKSFTGEDLLEIQTHGSFAIIEFILKELGKIPGFFMAKPGEFAQRALQNGKMTLLEVEALADVLNAQTENQLFLATQQAFDDHQNNIYQEWRQKLIKIMSNLEAFLSFPEEEISEEVVQNSLNIIDNLKKDFFLFLENANCGEILREGFDIAIVGAPNAGKSTLINHLMHKEVAIVSDIAGTTRDLLKFSFNLNGFLINLFDTAGLRENSQDEIEKIGIERAKNCLKKVNLIVFLQDIFEIKMSFFMLEKTSKISTIANIDKKISKIFIKKNEKFFVKKNFFLLQKIEKKNHKFFVYFSKKKSLNNMNNLEFKISKLKLTNIYHINYFISILNNNMTFINYDYKNSVNIEVLINCVIFNRFASHDIQQYNKNILHVVSKADDDNIMEIGDYLSISVHKNKNIDLLLKKISNLVSEFMPSSAEAKFIIRERHRQLLVNASEFLSEITAEMSLELIVECLRVAINNLSEIVGIISREDVLDKLFKDFCIGK